RQGQAGAQDLAAALAHRAVEFDHRGPSGPGAPAPPRAAQGSFYQDTDAGMMFDRGHGAQPRTLEVAACMASGAAPPAGGAATAGPSRPARITSSRCADTAGSAPRKNRPPSVGRLAVRLPTTRNSFGQSATSQARASNNSVGRPPCATTPEPV